MPWMCGSSKNESLSGGGLSFLWIRIGSGSFHYEMGSLRDEG